MDDNEQMPVWLGIPRTPIRLPHSEDAALKHLRDSVKPYHCYYCTSTLHPEESGKLSHKKANFVTWRVLMLDDIGTKVPVDRLPEALRKPTYIIESSPGNYQYGYVWETPVESLAEAEAFLQIIASADISDKGGLMPVKAARLPCGINGKKAKREDGYDKGAFDVRLVELHEDRLFDPDQILKALEAKIDWSELQKDAREASRRTAHMTMGSSLWSEAEYPTADGVIDPVLEWLNEMGEVKGDTGDFVNIACPWGHEHSNHDTTAGYRPLGRGDTPQTRAFHCFHDSCSSRTTTDFLAHVAAQGGPVGAVQDRVPHLTSTWIYDVIDNLVWKIRGGEKVQFVTPDAFNRKYARGQKIINPDGGIKMVPQHRLWLLSPARVDVYGRVLDPSTTARLVEDDHHLRLNTFCPPTWKKAHPDPFHVKRFMEFLEYLIPCETERAYFLNWLAAKAQNMAFRGAAIMMVARRQGTGRNTLADMVKRMFGDSNCRMVPLKAMLNDQFNDWQEAPMVFVEEVQTNDTQNGISATYERLKELVDVRPKRTTINPKYGKRRETMVYSSYLMFTNHTTALDFPANDRRLYVIENAAIPAAEQYFTDLNAWLEKDVWPLHVWNWLQNQQVDMPALTAPPKPTQMKLQMAQTSVSVLEKTLEKVMAYWPQPFFTPTDGLIVLERLAEDIKLYDMPDWEQQARTCMRSALLAMGSKMFGKDMNGRRGRVYMILSRAGDNAAKDIYDHRRTLDKDPARRKKIAHFFEKTTLEEVTAIIKKVRETLTLDAI
jgi:hypothetical protein